MTTFGERWTAAIAAYGGLCVGIDPHAALLAEWGLPDSGPGVRDFGLRVVEAAAGRVGVVKPQNAFFERHGAAGYAALEEVLRAARSAGLLVISDVKRGDIGSTVDAYGAAWLTPGGPLEADAMTAVAYQGVGSLAGVIDLALEHDKGVFVLAATSNPEAVPVQTARVGERTVAAEVLAGVRAADPGDGMRSIGIVVGGTVHLADYGIRTEDAAGVPILAPGFGAQGARVSDVRDLFGPLAPQVVSAVSREILGAGPAGLGAAIDAQLAELVA